MAGLSSAGIGSGLDVQGLVTKLMAVEQQPLTALNTKEATLQAKLSAFGTLKSSLSSLQSAANTLASPSTFTGRSASVSDATVLSASASSTAAAGSYDIAVTQIAKKLTVRSDAVYATTTDTFNTGSLDITVGSTTKTITIDSSNNTLAGISSAINAAGAGVSASIVNDGTTNRLVLTATDTGTTGSFTIAATDAGSGGTNALSDLAYAGGAGVGGQIVRVQTGDDAQLTVNGLSVTRSSNTVLDVIDGVTLSLTKSGGTSKLTVQRNTSDIATAVGNFVKTYNDARKLLDSVSAYSASTQTGSTLTGDATVRGIKSQLSNLLGNSVSGLSGDISRLSDIGISLLKDGSLSVNNAKLQAALDDPNKDVAGLFGSTSVDNKGIAVRFNEVLDGIVSTTGRIVSRTDGIASSISDIGKQRTALQISLTMIEKRYRAQFTALDTLMSSMTSTSNYLSQQLDQLAQLTISSNK